MLLGLSEWRLQHPTATLAEIEAAVDERLALASRAADLPGTPARERARCPGCGAELRPRGKKTRAMVTQRARSCGWRATTRCARLAGRAFSPLDAELELPAGRLSPRLQEGPVRLAEKLPRPGQLHNPVGRRSVYASTKVCASRTPDHPRSRPAHLGEITVVVAGDRVAVGAPQGSVNIAVYTDHLVLTRDIVPARGALGVAYAVALPHARPRRSETELTGPT